MAGPIWLGLAVHVISNDSHVLDHVGVATLGVTHDQGWISLVGSVVFRDRCLDFVDEMGAWVDALGRDRGVGDKSERGVRDAPKTSPAVKLC